MQNGYEMIRSTGIFERVVQSLFR